MTEKQSWSTENMAAAIEDVNKGMTYREAAKNHKVPFSTLQYRHKEAEKRGLSPLEAAQKMQHLWSEENMAAAIKDVMKGKMNDGRAAKFHNIPRSTLVDRIKKAKKESLSSLEAAPKKQEMETATRKRKLEIEAPKVDKLNKKKKQKDSSSSD